MPTTELPAAELAPYTGAQLRFARAAWPLRAANELTSALVFRELARTARRAALPSPWPARLASAAHDEIRHARLCVAVGASMGADPPRYDVHAVRARARALADPLARAASMLLVEVAIGETISMLLFRAGSRAATEPRTRAVLGAIARDEARHQRLGWSALVAVGPLLPVSVEASLEREAARGLAASERTIAVPAMRWLEEKRPFDPAWAALGVLAPEARVEAFYRAVERMVLPRLTAIGVDATRAWQQRYRSRRA